MKRMRLIVLFPLAALPLVAGCATWDRLSGYEFRGRGLETTLRPPPPPEVFASYDMRIDRDDPVGSVLRVGTGLAMAAQVHETQARLERVLEAVDVPEEIRRSSLEQVSDVLGCESVDRGERGDYELVLDIREYGIDARSWGSASEFRVSLRVSLRDELGTEIWRARVQETIPISPGIFGLSGAVGNVVTTVTLSELTDAEIGQGMMLLAQRVARRAADRLERDLERAGYW